MLQDCNSFLETAVSTPDSALPMEDSQTNVPQSKRVRFDACLSEDRTGTRIAVEPSAQVTDMDMDEVVHGTSPLATPPQAAP
eukprot:11813319-Prorocentrum_lima.AAC.1